MHHEKNLIMARRTAVASRTKVKQHGRAEVMEVVAGSRMSSEVKRAAARTRITAC